MTSDPSQDIAVRRRPSLLYTLLGSVTKWSDLSADAFLSVLDSIDPRVEGFDPHESHESISLLGQLLRSGHHGDHPRLLALAERLLAVGGDPLVALDSKHSKIDWTDSPALFCLLNQPTRGAGDHPANRKAEDRLEVDLMAACSKSPQSIAHAAVGHCLNRHEGWMTRVRGVAAPAWLALHAVGFGVRMPGWSAMDAHTSPYNYGSEKSIKSLALLRRAMDETTAMGPMAARDRWLFLVGSAALCVQARRCINTVKEQGACEALLRRVLKKMGPIDLAAAMDAYGADPASSERSDRGRVVANSLYGLEVLPLSTPEKWGVVRAGLKLIDSQDNSEVVFEKLVKQLGLPDAAMLERMTPDATSTNFLTRLFLEAFAKPDSWDWDDVEEVDFKDGNPLEFLDRLERWMETHGQSFSPADRGSLHELADRLTLTGRLASWRTGVLACLARQEAAALTVGLKSVSGGTHLKPTTGMRL